MELIDLNWLIVFFPFIIGTRIFKQFDTNLKLAYFFVCYSAFNELMVFTIRHILDLKNTMFFSNLYQLIFFPLIGVFYWKVLQYSFKGKWIVWGIIFVEIINLTYIVFIQRILSFPIFPRSLVTISVLVLSILYFYKVMNEARIENLWQEPLIWINLGLLIFYAGGFFFTILFTIILEYSRQFLKIIMYGHSLLNFVMYLFIGIGFLKAKRVDQIL